MTIFEQYTALQRQIKELQAQADSLKAQIIAEMPDKHYTTADGSLETFEGDPEECDNWIQKF